MGAVAGYTARWRYRSGLAALAVTDEERGGATGRVQATRLLAGPAWLPVFGGIEPYHRLLGALREVVHPAAIAEFAYDWRLSVVHNASLLAETIDRHLTAWRAHPDHAHGRRLHPEQRDAQVVVVAHSMGGLLARALSAVGGATDAIRMTITMGTPFAGSVKTLEALAHGRGLPVPLPADEVREMARTAPGLYDLLPAYRCHLVDGDARPLSAEVVTQLGGDGELAREAVARQQRSAGLLLPGHVLFAGIKQPTARSFDIRDGVVRLWRHGYRRDAEDNIALDAAGRPIPDDQGGDGTVYRYAASLPRTPARTFAQQHVALPRTRSILDNIGGLITEAGNLDIMLGANEFGLDIPDAVSAGEPSLIRIIGDVDPARLSCAIEDVADDDRVVARPLPTAGSDGAGAQVAIRLPRTGLYRIRVAAGSDPVSKLVLSVADGSDDGRPAG
ncbi:lipase/acyltransferase domain-containing protein [Nocardia sp. alder85J]|uniref:lipase/acyltransferase domain-containing protein n=1 Tax=Nocardia sp. alder85J TaxID=2862949 RepID=UPI001CD20930|nr:hypothetical protein [Nocardia sp. alder85J]MCX4094965.1 hypothetical protein [Nocardia sp. alder85J]